MYSVSIATAQLFSLSYWGNVSPYPYNGSRYETLVIGRAGSYFLAHPGLVRPYLARAQAKLGSVVAGSVELSVQAVGETPTFSSVVFISPMILLRGGSWSLHG